ncbi:MAG: DUF418 domain-containing protein [Muribaculaceae bacterium]|nr:DUF418 domain-containing protein [Muribaculaceae bacterium]
MTISPQRHQRVDVADVLRGFAVLAIILLHAIEHFNFYQFPDTSGQPAWLTFADKAIWNGLFFMFGGKAYAIFALLFGFSFFIQHDNQRMRGNDFRLRFCWRLVLLFIIGQVNAAFFTGEVLVLYSLVGFVLVPTCRLSTKKVLTISAICLLQPICVYQIIRAILDPAYTIPDIDDGPFWAATFAVQNGGSFLETVKVNLWEGQLASLAWAWEHGRVLQTAGLFLAGMIIGRNGWFRRENLHIWGKTLAAAIISFFPLYGLNNMVGDYIGNPNILIPLKIILSSLANVCFMAILVCGVIFGYYRTSRLSHTLSLLIPYGKMSMTNYVTQGIIGSLIYYNWGFHLQMGIAGSEIIGIVIFLVQYALCRIWLDRHSHGPLEYLWKKATWIEFPFHSKKGRKP